MSEIPKLLFVNRLSSDVFPTRNLSGVTANLSPDSKAVQNPMWKLSYHLQEMISKVLKEHIMPKMAKGSQEVLLDLTQQYTVDLKGRPLGIWNHKTKNLIRYNNKLVMSRNLGFRHADADFMQQKNKPARLKRLFLSPNHQLSSPNKMFVGIYRGYILLLYRQWDKTEILACRWDSLTEDLPPGESIASHQTILPTSVCLQGDMLAYVQSANYASQGKICILKLCFEGESRTATEVCSGDFSRRSILPVLFVCKSATVSSQTFRLLAVSKQHCDKRNLLYTRKVQ